MTNSYRILIVEDERPLLDALMTKLRHAGFEVFGAKNGIEGLEMALQYQPNLILLDLLMPQLGGLEMLERLHTQDSGKAIPVLVLTNFNQVDYLDRANKLGVKEYLVKANYSLAEIVKRVKHELRGD